MKTILTIAGFDPTGGAGLQADLQVFAEHKLQGLSAITAVTAQDGVRVTMIEPVSPAVLRKQLDTLLAAHKQSKTGYRIDAVKIGMLGTGALADVVRLAIKRHRLTNVVLDTVLASSSGKKLIDKDGTGALKKLIASARLITPNIIEAAVLTGTAINNIKNMEAAAVELYRLGAQNVLITGGHLRGAPIDVLYDGKRFHRFEGRRIKADKKALHGTGCILSSAIAAKLAKGRTIKTAVKEAKAYLEEVIRTRLKDIK